MKISIFAAVIGLLVLSCNEQATPMASSGKSVMSTDGYQITVVSDDALLAEQEQTAGSVSEESSVTIESSPDAIPGEEMSTGAGDAEGVTSDTSSSDQSAEQATGDANESEVASDDDSVQPTSDDLANCGLKFNKDIKRIVVASRLNKINVDASTVLAVRVTGNQNHVAINTVGETKIGGFCFFLAGNKAQLSLSVEGADVGNVFYKARGNQSSGSISVGKERSIDSISVDFKGNGQNLEISGDGKYDCPESSGKPGKSQHSEVVCK